MQSFTDIALAAYCPRKLYYRRRDDTDPPGRDERHELAGRYPELLAGTLTEEPIAVSPTTWRSTMGQSRARLGERLFESLCAPDECDTFLKGRDAWGIAHKIIELETGAPVVGMVFGGQPPDEGVWAPQSVRTVAAMQALSWEREEQVERAVVEYPAHGILREFELTARRAGQYRRALRVARSIDGPPNRIHSKSKCERCEYRAECGVRTRSLRSLLG